MVVVATGIGPVAAALCTLELLVCGQWIKDIVYVGTSGWSPQRGGVLSVQPYEGQEAECVDANPSHVPNRIGDMCVSGLAVNWVCKKADYLQQCGRVDTLCTMPGVLRGGGLELGTCAYACVGVYICCVSLLCVCICVLCICVLCMHMHVLHLG